ncbi:MAG TPA: hypothetical protein IAC96_05645 [Candidatus Fimimorpha faecalis]|uniref:Uncharacterized protein n=1 Tax=Candidatus Fimimorpha faecalis TaxID=2840824 RepID=A0A9D1EDL0_9FIRM|nr:hypothetical protein NDGK_00253 [Clostridiales bacterium CHKCI001]HIR88417.1 hypothetical protein [Candidatus Fimimorpha faecalis]
MKKLKKVLTLACIGTSLLLNTSGVFAANVILQLEIDNKEDCCRIVSFN